MIAKAVFVKEMNCVQTPTGYSLLYHVFSSGQGAVNKILPVRRRSGGEQGMREYKSCAERIISENLLHREVKAAGQEDEKAI